MKVFVIPDLHFPFFNKRAYNKMMKHLKAEKPTHVVQLGDILDQYVFSKYSKSLEITPEQEITKGVEMMLKFWEDVKKAAPKAKRYQLLGNHDQRLSKKIADKVPELAFLLSSKDLYQIPGVKVLDSDRDYLVLQGVVYVHGWLSKSEDHCKFFNMPVVHGHTHRPKIHFENPRLWSMDCGHLADKNSIPLQYTASKFSKWTMACAVVENKQPRLIILE